MITIVIIAITCLVSILCFNAKLNGSRLLFNAYQVWHRKEWYRIWTDYGLYKITKHSSH